MNERARRGTQYGSIVLAVLCLALGLLLGRALHESEGPTAPDSRSVTPIAVPPVLTTNLYRIRTREILLPFPDEDGRASGGFDVASDSLLYAVTVSGKLYRVSTSASSFIDGGGAVSFDLIDSLRRSLPPLPVGFGAKSLTVLDAQTLLISFAEYRAERECADLSVVRVHLGGDGPAAAPDTVFRSRCTPRAVVSHSMSEGISSGGEVQVIDRAHILVSVGDFYHDSLAEDPRSDWGKVMLVNLASRTSRIFTRGHRNPQGLYITRTPFRIFETEHGPQGGDEINVLTDGADYGWPFVTYGHPYLQQLPPFDGDESDFANRYAAVQRTPLSVVRTYGSHGQGPDRRFTEPLFVFTPSIGISRIVSYPCPLKRGSKGGAPGGPVAAGDVHRLWLWCDDLIVGSLIGESLFRVVVTGLDPGSRPTVRMVEPIPVRRRIRGLRLLPNGALMMKTDRASLVLLWHNNN